MLRYYLETFGCQMNQLDSELVEALLRDCDAVRTDTPADADLVLFNTCSVRQHAEDKVYSRLGELRHTKQQRPEMLIAVIGCMAEQEAPTILKRMPHVDVLCGPGQLHQLPVLIERARSVKGGAIGLTGRYASMSTQNDQTDRFARLEDLELSRPAARGDGRFQAFLRITRGCNKFCSFCVVPYVRGPEVHRSSDDIIAEAKRLADAGVVEITLLGQTVNHYVWNGGGKKVRFADLLRMVHDAVPSVRRLRFLTSYPRDFTTDTLQVMAEYERICPYLHIPAQSGSNAVLRRMNRGYTVEQYKELIDKARQIVPGISLAGDMIVGFCGETEQDHEASMDLLRYVRYKNCFIFKYSPRPGTLACRRFADDVPEDLKRRRHREMLELQNSISLQANHAVVGRTVEVLVEGPSKRAGKVSAEGTTVPSNDRVQMMGRTAGDQIVVFDGPRSLAGRFVRVCIEAATPMTLQGRIVEDGTAATSI